MSSFIIFDSIAAMLEPDAISALLGKQVYAVMRQPFEVAHRSANALHEIWLETGTGRERLVLKEFLPARDWVMLLTHDTLTREAMLFVQGIYAQLPNEIYVPVIAVARNGDTWATLMRDVSSQMLPADRVLSEDDARVLIDHLAALHAHFWNKSSIKDPALGLSSLQDFLTILAPERVQGEIQSGRSHPVMEMAARGWQKFFEDAPKDASSKIRAIQQNPERLLNELQRIPQTLVHADFKLGNLGIARTQSDSPKTVLLDWQDATRGAGVLDLGYFLALNARWLPLTKEDAIQSYVNALAARRHTVSTRQVEIGLLAGGALRLLWLMMLTQQNELDWWYDLIRRVDVIS